MGGGVVVEVNKIEGYYVEYAVGIKDDKISLRDVVGVVALY